MEGSVGWTDPATLSWAQVDPARRDFDPDGALAVVRALPPAGSVPPPAPPVTSDHRSTWTTRLGMPWTMAMTEALVEHYGLWAIGWRWAVDEGDHDGGVVRTWCCAPHSIKDPETTLRAVAGGLVEWHLWLVELAERFDRFLPLPGRPASAGSRTAASGGMVSGLVAPDGVPDGPSGGEVSGLVAPDGPSGGEVGAWERAVAHLVTVVAERTGAGSAWYNMCALVLRWFLTAAGIGAHRHAELIDSAIGGRFRSWTEPDLVLVTEVARRLATGATGQVDA